MFDGSKLKNLRQGIGLNQKELANLLDSSQKNISNYENGRARPDYEALIAMSKLFNVSVDYLLNVQNMDTYSLSENESYIINTYRSLDESHRFDFISLIRLIHDLNKEAKKE